MRAHRVVPLGVVRLEVVGEPVIQALGQRGAVDLPSPPLECIHDPAQVVEQPLVIALVRRQARVGLIVHQLFLEREMGRYALEQVAEDRRHRGFGARSAELGVQPIDEIDQLSVLVVDGFDADAVFRLPLQ
jgi:hypothetical protein